MKKTISILFLFGLLISCSDSTNKSEKSKLSVNYFSYHVYFTPAFMPMCSISIIQRKEIGKIKFTIYRFCDTTRTYKIFSTDSSVLGKSDLNYFYSVLDTISLIKMKSDSSIGLDGIGVHNTVYLDSLKNEFYFWSPDKERKPKEHKIIEAIIGLSRLKFTKQKQQEYFESLEQYFDFGLPCKKISDNPYEIRIYGGLSANEEEELNNFINNLPSNKPILVDMTNFEGMGTMYYDLFRSLISRNKNIIWVATYKQQLKEIGIDTAKIVDNINIGRQLIKKNSP